MMRNNSIPKEYMDFMLRERRMSRADIRDEIVRLRTKLKNTARDQADLRVSLLQRLGELKTRLMR